jgi:hypothetical protein
VSSRRLPLDQGEQLARARIDVAGAERDDQIAGFDDVEERPGNVFLVGDVRDGMVTVRANAFCEVGPRSPFDRSFAGR